MSIPTFCVDAIGSYLLGLEQGFEAEKNLICEVTFCQIWKRTRQMRSVSPLSVAFASAVSSSSMLSNKGTCHREKKIQVIPLLCHSCRGLILHKTNSDHSNNICIQEECVKTHDSQKIKKKSYYAAKSVKDCHLLQKMVKRNVTFTNVN